jgi:hypothetical protein
MTHPARPDRPDHRQWPGHRRRHRLQLAQRGAPVAVAARSEAELAETTSPIVAAGGRAHPIVADLAGPGSRDGARAARA